jgi:periplasmic nitrate reductase NapE
MTVSHHAADDPHMSPATRRRRELLTFLFLTIFLAPLLAVAFVGSYGFAIWFYQIFTGPPGA